MRPIKFRAWDTVIKQWRPFDDDSLLISADGSITHYDDETILMQFGLTDKNGKEIYEGDVVRDEIGDAQVVFGDDEIGKTSWDVPIHTPGYSKLWLGSMGGGHSSLDA